MSRLALPSVTLCAATSVNVEATVAALEACLDQVSFARSLLLTDKHIISPDPSLEVVTIPRIGSATEYSSFILNHLADHIESEHCLIVQWDGFILDRELWHPAFLDFDYIGAPWPQFDDGYNVGNGGFSLRSKRLLIACRDPQFRFDSAEDIAICRVNRSLLEANYGIRFADAATAHRFAFERFVPAEATFGFHGLFNMISALGPEEFWELYIGLDNPSMDFADCRSLLTQLSTGRNRTSRRLRLAVDGIRHIFGKSAR